MSTALFIIIAIALIVPLFSYLRNQQLKTQLLTLNKNRPTLTRTEYIQQLTKEGFDRTHVETVYEEIAQFINLPNFSLYPEDSIHDHYRIDDLDDVELINRICNKLNLRTPEQSDYDSLNGQYSETTARTILTLTQNLQRDTVYNKRSCCTTPPKSKHDR